MTTEGWTLLEEEEQMSNIVCLIRDLHNTDGHEIMIYRETCLKRTFMQPLFMFELDRFSVYTAKLTRISYMRTCWTIGLKSIPFYSGFVLDISYCNSNERHVSLFNQWTINKYEVQTFISVQVMFACHVIAGHASYSIR
jgi:hypothetical protein